jgi:hypothetical protein
MNEEKRKMWSRYQENEPENAKPEDKNKKIRVKEEW